MNFFYKASAPLLFMLSAFFTVTSYSMEATDKAITLGIHPYKAPGKLIKVYQPLADLISSHIHRPVKIVISKNYSTHIQKIGADELDIAYLGPASYVKLVNQFGKKQILARQAINQKPTFQGKIIIRSDSPIKTLAELKDKRFAFGDPNSTMSHLVPRYMLIKSGVLIDKLQKYDFLGSHDNVALSVLTGDYDAGAVKEAVYYKYKKRGIKALATTPALSEHLFIANNKLTKTLVKQIRNILLDLKNTEQGRQVMSSIKSNITSMMPAKDSDYDNLRDILQTLQKQK